MVDAEPDALRDAKLETLDDFRRGIEHARAGDIDRAQTHFATCLTRNQDDFAVAVWAARCETWKRDGLPSGHDGVTVLDHK